MGSDVCACVMKGLLVFSGSGMLMEWEWDVDGMGVGC